MCNYFEELMDRVEMLKGEKEDRDILTDIITLCETSIDKIDNEDYGYYLVIIGEQAMEDENLITYYFPMPKNSKRNVRYLADTFAKRVNNTNKYKLLEITEEKYNEYISLIRLTELRDRLTSLKYSSHGQDFDLEISVQRDINRLRQKLNLTSDLQIVLDNLNSFPIRYYCA